MADELSLQPAGRHSSSRTRTGEERLLGLLQGRYGLFAGDRREVLEELGKGLARLEVVQQRRQRHAGTDEHGRAAHDFRVAVNDRFVAVMFSVQELSRPVYRTSAVRMTRGARARSEFAFNAAPSGE